MFMSLQMMVTDNDVSGYVVNCCTKSLNGMFQK